MPCSYARLLASIRKNNEDRVEVFEHEDVLVVVVADGAGGLRGGATASDAVVVAAADALSNPAFSFRAGSSWAKLLLEVDAQLSAKMAGETTAVVVVISPHGLIGASAGDSQAWVISGENIDELTQGQNKKRLGSGRAAPVAFSRPALEGALVVASDGLFSYAHRENIAAAVRGRSPEQAVELLRGLVQLPSGAYHDDLGVVVVAPMGASRA